MSILLKRIGFGRAPCSAATSRNRVELSESPRSLPSYISLHYIADCAVGQHISTISHAKKSKIN